MKYLIQNRKEFAISVGFFVMTIVELIKAIMSKNVTEELIMWSVYAFLSICAWYYNMPTSEENCIATGEMRMMKEQNKGNFDGEDFTDEAEEVPEKEEEDA